MSASALLFSVNEIIQNNLHGTGCSAVNINFIGILMLKALSNITMFTGLCMFSCGCFSIMGETAPVGSIVLPPEVINSYSPEAAVNRVITEVSIKSITLFGGRAPLVKLETHGKGALGDVVYRKLVGSRTFKPYFEGLTAEPELIFYSLQEENSQSNEWIIKIKRADDKSVLWESRIKLAIN